MEPSTLRQDSTASPPPENTDDDDVTEVSVDLQHLTELLENIEPPPVELTRMARASVDSTEPLEEHENAPPREPQEERCTSTGKDEPTWLQNASIALNDQDNHGSRPSELNADSETTLPHRKATEHILLDRPEGAQPQVVKRPVQKMEQSARTRFNRR